MYVRVKQLQQFVKYLYLNILSSAEIKWETSLSSPKRQSLLLKFLFRSRLSIPCLVFMLSNIIAAFVIFAAYLNPPVGRGLAKLREKQPCRGKTHKVVFGDPHWRICFLRAKWMFSLAPLPVFWDHTYT